MYGVEPLLKVFDCSGFLKYVFEKGAGVTLPRTVSGIYKKGEKLPVYLETGFYLLSNKGYDIEMSYDE
ncbi:NlpC/P60 family protein [Peribacillus sp. FSL E2-0159]|uniref:NlpC/P60 family protein n=1 Tax=Peribacillus sp. FSL E2-0159 TaxID=2975289 RepID=UPI00315AD8CD